MQQEAVCSIRLFIEGLGGIITIFTFPWFFFNKEN